MSAQRMARGPKGRVALYIGAVLLIGAIVVLVHETQTRVDEARRSSEKCQQQQESLSAQLQVIFEYKTRLEKSVQQEKAEHKKTQDDLGAQLDTEKTKRAREVLEATNKLASLQQHYKLLQGQHEELADECKGVRSEAFKAWEEQRSADAALTTLRQQTDRQIKTYQSQLAQLKSENEKLKRLVQEDGSEVANLQDDNHRLDTELQQCKKDLSSCPTSKSSGLANAPNLQSPMGAQSSSSAVPVPANNAHNVLQQPDRKQASSANPSSSSSTPRVAPMVAPGAAGEQLPAGVVPPAAVPAQDGAQAGPPPEEERAVGAAPPPPAPLEQQRMWHHAEEDGAGPVGRLLPENEHHEDLQLEDPDEDEGDDDVDQIDYANGGNDIVNNEEKRRPKQLHRKLALGGRAADGVMVNPK